MLKLIPPGKRKNKFWGIRGSIDGHKIEKSTRCRLRADAEKLAKQLVADYENNKNISENVTFQQAGERYIEFRNFSDEEANRIKKLYPELGHLIVTEIKQHTLVSAASKLFPNAAPATRNRAVMCPAAAVLHYSARNEWCSWLRVDKFKQPTAKTRFVDPSVEHKLLAYTESITKVICKKHLLILWLFRQGDRISDVCQIKYEDCDLQSKTVSRYISKSDRYMVLPLDEEIVALLAKDQKDGKKTGYLFPWQTKWGVYNWLRPLCKRLKVEFTPHRARHTLGKRLNDGGAALKTIMQILGQSDPQSAIRYQTTDIEALRTAKKKAGTR